MSRTTSTLALTVVLLSSALFGLGCTKSTDQQAADVQAKLRQPPAATAPTKQPDIPAEAAKVPRPY